MSNNELYRIGDCHEFLSLPIWDLDAQFFFEIHHDRVKVQTVRAEVFERAGQEILER